MLDQMKLQSETTRTENGALAWRSSGSDCLNFFAMAGALRGADEQRVFRLFIRAFEENPDYALRTLFYARDIRGGLGERLIFRRLMKWLADTHGDTVRRNIRRIAQYGRFDDLLTFLGTPCEQDMTEEIKARLQEDIEKANRGEAVSLLGKWLPSINTASEETRRMAARLAKLLKMSHREYRKTLSMLRGKIDIIEHRLCGKDYSFDYEKQTSGSMFRYRRAFARNDRERYTEFIEAVKRGGRRLHAETLYPYEIVRRCRMMDEAGATDVQERSALDAAWKSLPCQEDHRNALVVVDGSGSMYWEGWGDVLPIDAAVSLGIYFAERNTGYFRNHFITFSETPRLIEIKGGSILSKVRYCMSYNECANTDLYEVFMLLLITAVKNKLPQEELPETVYIISDMEFDDGVTPDRTVFEDAREKFEDYGYRLPNLVYWNVCSHRDQLPVRMNDKGTALVSGSSPSVFRLAMDADTDPMRMMVDTLEGERYRDIFA